MQIAIEPKSKADNDKMGAALYKLAQEDPSFHFSRDDETNQTVIEGMGELHLDIIVDRMKREFNVAADIGAPQVSYSYGQHMATWSRKLHAIFNCFVWEINEQIVYWYFVKAMLREAKMILSLWTIMIIQAVSLAELSCLQVSHLKRAAHGTHARLQSKHHPSSRPCSAVIVVCLSAFHAGSG